MIDTTAKPLRTWRVEIKGGGVKTFEAHNVSLTEAGDLVFTTTRGGTLSVTNTHYVSRGSWTAAAENLAPVLGS